MKPNKINFSSTICFHIREDISQNTSSRKKLEEKMQPLIDKSKEWFDIVQGRAVQKETLTLQPSNSRLGSD